MPCWKATANHSRLATIYTLAVIWLHTSLRLAVHKTFLVQFLDSHSIPFRSASKPTVWRHYCHTVRAIGICRLGSKQPWPFVLCKHVPRVSLLRWYRVKTWFHSSPWRCRLRMDMRNLVMVVSLVSLLLTGESLHRDNLGIWVCFTLFCTRALPQPFLQLNYQDPI